LAKSKKREKVNYLEYTFTIFEKYDIWQISFKNPKDGSMIKRSTKLAATPSNLISVKKEIIPQIVEALTGKITNFEDEENKEYTVEEWTEDFFLAYKGTVRPHVAKRNLGHFNRHIKPYFGHRIITSIKPIELEKWQNQLLQKYKNSTVVKYRSVFMSILDNATENDVIQKNPLRKVKSPKTIKKVTMNDIDIDIDIFPFSEKEIKIILENTNGYLKNFIMLMFSSGIRPGEIIALLWKDIDFDKKQISIYKTIVNSHKGPVKTLASKRKIDMLPMAEFALKKQFELTGYQEIVFLSSFHKQFYSHDIIGVHFKKVLKKVNIQVRKLYNLRHTFASQLISKGEDITWVSKTLGHESVQTTLKYYTKYIIKEEDARIENISKIGANFGANILEEAQKLDK